jgi:quercetin dioxygenase-like cupin family protein
MMEPDKKPSTSDKLAAQALKLTDVISYQDDSVVSRTLVNQANGTVTLFAFGNGQGLSEHTAPFDALVYMLDGEADITIAGKTVRARSGDLVIMPAHQPHALDAVTPFKMMLTMIRS